jgi:predicted 3-demethylubiquinone-9 3-methyltransferase (glyoxalase superfamily)
LWFDDQAEAAARFYVSVFKNSRIRGTARYGPEAARVAGRPEGSVMTVNFELDGQEFVGLNGGPIVTFTEAMSLVVDCETQDEIDELWAKLSAGGEEGQCGWLKDRFGVSWQIIPRVRTEMVQDKDVERSRRVIAALLRMNKIGVRALQAAYEGRGGSA